MEAKGDPTSVSVSVSVSTQAQADILTFCAPILLSDLDFNVYTSVFVAEQLISPG
jgi:hypothetical protein